MWKKVETTNSGEETWVMSVEGGWFVRHTDPSSASLFMEFFPDPNHLSFQGSVPADPTLVPAPTPVPVNIGTHLDVVYDGTWASGWAHNSWGVVNDSFIDTLGNSVIRADIDSWTALNISYRNGKMFSTLDTIGVSMMIKGEGDGSQISRMRVCFVDGTSVLGHAPLTDFLPNGIPVGTDPYTKIEVTFDSLGIAKAFATNIWIQGIDNGMGDAILVKDVNLIRRNTQLVVADVPLPTTSVAVRPTPFNLDISYNKIVDANTRAPWVGHGVNLHDTRGNNACAYNKPDVDEVIRRLIYLKDSGVTFVRLLLESYLSANGRTQYASVLDDPAYLDDVIRIVNAAGTLGLTMMITPWVDPSYPTSQGAPTPYLTQVWRALSHVFKDAGHVMFGILNEPTGNYDGSLNAERRAGYEEVIAAIRANEGASQHIVTVQGIGGWARNMTYWVDNPMQDPMVAYEVHAYDAIADFDKRFVIPSAKLPLVIGEFGPDGTYMQLADAAELIKQAAVWGIPWLGWAFHPKSKPSMLVNSGSNCGIGMNLSQHTAWGDLIFNNL